MISDDPSPFSFVTGTAVLEAFFFVLSMWFATTICALGTWNDEIATPSVKNHFERLRWCAKRHGTPICCLVNYLGLKSILGIFDFVTGSTMVPPVAQRLPGEQPRLVASSDLGRHLSR